MAMPAVAFLSLGGGALSATRGSAGLERLLIATSSAVWLPLAKLPRRWRSYSSLGALALLAFEARRAAARRLLWLDDAGRDLERETPVWRALLVFAAFVGLQGLTSLIFSWTAIGATLAVAYLVSATALVLLTLNGRQGLTPLAWKGTRTWLIPVGMAVGASAGWLAIGYGKPSSRNSAWTPGRSPTPWKVHRPPCGSCSAATVILGAPIAEELFFRGWLQPAIRIELPPRWKRRAPSSWQPLPLPRFIPAWRFRRSLCSA